MIINRPIFWVDCWKAAAVPWKLPVMVSGTCASSLAFLMPVTASLKVLPGAMSKDRVTAGTWPAWLTLSGMVLAVIWVTALMGTRLGTPPPPPPATGSPVAVGVAVATAPAVVLLVLPGTLAAVMYSRDSEEGSRWY